MLEEKVESRAPPPPPPRPAPPRGVQSREDPSILAVFRVVNNTSLAGQELASPLRQLSQ